jgi:hypothetical protein
MNVYDDDDTRHGEKWTGTERLSPVRIESDIEQPKSDIWTAVIVDRNRGNQLFHEPAAGK